MKIIATGSALPHLELTNYDLSQYVDTSDEWIYSRTGIKSRRVISTETITGLAVNAAKNCIESSGVSADEIDYILDNFDSIIETCKKLGATVEGISLDRKLLYPSIFSTMCGIGPIIIALYLVL